MSKQLTRIEEAIFTFKDRSLALPVIGSSTLHPVSIKPPLEVTNFKLKASNTEFMDTLLQKIQTLNVRPSDPNQPPGPSGGSVQMLRAEPTNANEILSPDQIYEIQMNFQEPSSVNKLHSYSSSRPAMLPPSRNYYATPTPPDVLYEETYINDQGSYHGKTIYEWNIDGESEYGIYKKLHQMLMYATVCRQYSNQDQAIAKFIINGFTGQLKGWWDIIGAH